MRSVWPNRADHWAEARACLLAILLSIVAVMVSRVIPVPVPLFLLVILIAGLQTSELAPYVATVVAAFLYYAFLLGAPSSSRFHNNYTELSSLVLVGGAAAMFGHLQRNRCRSAVDRDMELQSLVTKNEPGRGPGQILPNHVEAIPGLMYIRKPDGTLEHINHRVIEFSGVPVEVMLRDNGCSAVHPDDFARVCSLCRSSFKRELPFSYEFRHRSADGSYRWVLASAEPERNERGEVVRWYTLLTDIEDRKAMENSLRLAQAKLAEASRISTVAELTASVAHEISQPLSGIIANAQACLRYLGAKPIDEELLSTGIQRILRDGRDASQTVRNVRALFRRKHPEAQPIDLQQLVQEVLLLHEARIRELGITVKVEVGKDVPSVPADRLQIQQLLANLIRNAIESMEFSPKAARELDVQVLNGTDMVVVAIADTGMGLSNPEKLFDPFFTTKHSGMGMGLRICKTIVEAHEGKLWADARPTRGATFTFSLPLERGAV